MSLSAASQTARASLGASSIQSAIVTRNIASAGEAGYARRVAALTSREGFGPLVSVSRVAATAAREAWLGATSDVSSASASLAGCAALSAVVGDPDDGRSISGLIAALGAALIGYATSPAEESAGAVALAAARDLAGGIRESSRAIGAVRQQADSDLADAAGRVTDLLVRFQSANEAVVRGLAASRDVADELDARDHALAGIAAEIGVEARARADGGLALFTDSGVTLFDRVPRRVGFVASNLAPGAAGAALTIDGVDVTSAASPAPLKSGRVAALASLRDELGPMLEAQFDETARGLILAFAESDQRVPPIASDAPGLFTWSEAPALPGAARVPGIASGLVINVNADPASGGEVRRIRDGGLADPSGATYVYNVSGAAGYTERLRALADAPGAVRAFDTTAGLGPSASLAGFAAASAGFIEEARKSASETRERQNALAGQAALALSNEAGVSIDDEMARMLDVERSWQASAKLLTTVDSMLETLLQAVG